MSIEQNAGSRTIELLIPEHECDGDLVPADPAECGPDTLNEECDDVCDGDVVVTNKRRPGLISGRHDSFGVLLDAQFVPIGPVCAALGGSIAEADLTKSGVVSSGHPRAVSMDAGLITAVYGAGCLVVGDLDMNDEIDAAVASAGVKITTGFTGVRR